MLNSKLLENKVQKFINQCLDEPIGKLALRSSPFEGIQTPEILQQIQAKKKCKKKLPTWYNTPRLYFPNKLNIEQTSSETSAKYKSNLVKGKTLLDLTGGFGVDSLYFSKIISSVTHCEIDEHLSEIVAHNFKTFGNENIKTIAIDGLEFLTQNKKNFDWIYIDPSRRDSNKNKRYFIEDCTPNIAEHLDLLFKNTQQILIKMSPMLDLKVALMALPQTKAIHVVAIKNEVKELLFILEKKFCKEPTIKAINLETNQSDFEFKYSDEVKSTVSYQNSLKYLYEPNSAVLKSGAFKNLAYQFDLKKLSQHSHLYTSMKLNPDFPGKIYLVEQELPYQKKNIRRIFSGSKANIKTRNFPKSIDQLKKEIKVADGGSLYVFFTTVGRKKIVILTKKLSNIND